MDMLPSLCAAMERAGGDSLVLREGMPPHVLAGASRHDVARAVLSHNALEALVRQIFSESARLTLADAGSAWEVVTVPEASLVLMAKVTREGDVLGIELARHAEEAPSAPGDTLTLAPAIEVAAGPAENRDTEFEDGFSATHVPDIASVFADDVEHHGWTPQAHETPHDLAPSPYVPPVPVASDSYDSHDDTAAFDAPGSHYDTDAQMTRYRDHHERARTDG